MRRILALTPIETASEPARFRCKTDPCRGHVATSHAFETSQSSGKDAVMAGIAHSNPIATHRIRHATGFLQTTLSKLPRQFAQQVQLRARGSPDRILTFTKTHQVHRMIARLIVRTLLVNRHDDGSAGDANYGRIGQGYTATVSRTLPSPPSSRRLLVTWTQCSIGMAGLFCTSCDDRNWSY
jgi:hypothetical protein